ncbi:hypothetical protein, partial [Bacillus haynesii]
LRHSQELRVSYFCRQKKFLPKKVDGRFKSEYHYKYEINITFVLQKKMICYEFKRRLTKEHAYEKSDGYFRVPCTHSIAAIYHQ